MGYTSLASVRPATGAAISRTGFYDVVDSNFAQLEGIVAYYVTNSSGGTVNQGDVGVFSGTADAAWLTSTTVGDLREVGVILGGTVNPSAQDYAGVAGHITPVNVTGTVARGDPLQISATAKRAQTGAVGAFATALTGNPSGNGTVQALLDPGAARRDAPRVSTLYDTGNVNRLIPNPTAKTIANGSPTSLADIACASGAVCGGVLHYLVRVFDATDWQALSGIVTYSAVNKAGTLTLTITENTANQAKAVSAGTLTLAWTFVTGTAKGTIKLQPTTSLASPNPFDVTYTLLPLIGTATIL